MTDENGCRQQLFQAQQREHKKKSTQPKKLLHKKTVINGGTKKSIQNVENEVRNNEKQINKTSGSKQNENTKCDIDIDIIEKFRNSERPVR